MKHDKNKYEFGTVKVGTSGEVILSAKALEIFQIASGDELLVLGDTEKGIAVVKNSGLFAKLTSGKHPQDGSKYVFGTAAVGDGGAFLLPPEALKVFQMVSGDTLLVVGDKHKGIALLKNNGRFAELIGEEQEETV